VVEGSFKASSEALLLSKARLFDGCADVRYPTFDLVGGNDLDRFAQNRAHQIKPDIAVGIARREPDALIEISVPIFGRLAYPRTFVDCRSRVSRS